MKLKGWKAIEAKERGDDITLNKYNDPVERARSNLSASEARDVAREDPSLIYGTKSRRRFKSNPMRKRSKISKAAMRRRMAKVRAGKKGSRRRTRRNPYTAKSRRTRRAFVGASRNGHVKRKRRRRRYPSRTSFAKGSFRAVRSGGARIIVGCRKGHWSKKRKKGHECNVGMRPYRVKRNPARRRRESLAYRDRARLPKGRTLFAVRQGGKTVVFRAAGKPTRVGSFSARGLRSWAGSHGVKIR